MDSNRFFQTKSLSYHPILTFGPAFSLISESLVEQFFSNSKKLWFWAKMAIFWHVWPKSAKMRIFIKNRAVLFFTLIVPQLHAKFHKNRWSGFRDQFVTSIHTSIHTSGQRWSHRTGRFRWFNMFKLYMNNELHDEFILQA